MVLLLLLALAIPPKPAHYVTDAAGVLDDARESALNERLAQLARDETAQILVYVDRKLPPNTPIRQFGAEAIRQWAPGTKEKDNGAILFVFIDDRESRIEVGYGLEGMLTDAKSKRILVGMRPALREGDYIGAVETGASQIADVALGKQLPRPRARLAAPVADPFEGTAVVLFMLLMIAGMVAFTVSLYRMSTDGEPDDDSSSSYDDSPPYSSYDDSSSSSSSSDWSSSSSSGSSSSSSSSSSGYSGGGGSGGGGGASDKW